MTVSEVKREAARLGYRLQKIPPFDCSCYLPYPNERYRKKNGSWKCVDRYEGMTDYDTGRHYSPGSVPCTHCRKK